MAREILFKAKRKDNGEWVEGLLWKKKYNTDKIFISCFPDKDDNEEVVVVKHDTICQYTGLTDKNGNKIWENDIVKCYCIDIANREYEFASNVFWDDCMWMLHETECCDNMLHHFDMSKNWMSHIPEIEVIGNIFDNPELVEMGCE